MRREVVAPRLERVWPLPQVRRGFVDDDDTGRHVRGLGSGHVAFVEAVDELMDRGR